MICLYSGILLSHKKEWNVAIYNNIDGPRDYHTKWSKSDRERQISYDLLICGIWKKDTNELTYKTDPQISKTNLWLPKGKGGDKLGWWD